MPTLQCVPTFGPSVARMAVEESRADAPRPPRGLGERRWPMAAAVLVSVAMQLSLPDRHVLSPSVLFPTVEVLLLVVLVIGDPGRVDRRSPVLTRVTVGLVIVMTVDNLAGVAELVRDILDGSDRDNGTVLLATGVLCG